MPFHRIDKYSRQIVCQDFILSCQSKNVKDIPLFTRATISKLSLRDRRATPGELFSARDLYLSGMLVNWHLWNQRGIPFSRQRRDINPERARRSVSERRERACCESSLTLRKKGLCVAIEKYLLFLMPRDITRKRVLPVLDRALSRTDCGRLSAFYMDTALGLRQYLYDNEKRRHTAPVPQWKPLSPEKMHFPFLKNKLLADMCVPHMFCQDKKETRIVQRSQDKSSCNTPQKLQSHGSYSRRHLGLSLYCPSILNSPDIQDIAQSGFMTLEGHVTLELS